MSGSRMRALVWDVETNALPANKGGEVLCVGWKLLPDGEVRVEAGMPEELQEMLSDHTLPKVEMTKYDARYARLQGYDVQGPIYDLQVMSYVLNENQPLDLDSLAMRYLQLKMDKRISRGDHPTFRADDGQCYPLTELQPGHVAWEQLLAYNARDVEAEADLFAALWRRLDDTDWLSYFLEEMVPFTGVLLDMECAGLPVNLQDSEALREELEEQAEDMEASLRAEADLPESFNLNSGDHLASYLYYPVFELRDALPISKELRGAIKSGQENGSSFPENFTVGKVGRAYAHGFWTLKGRAIMPTEKTPGGDRWSTASPVLRSNYVAMLDPWVSSLLAYKRVQKMLTTYLRPMPERLVEGRLYGTYSQTGTKTGRLSSAGPNMQNMPSHGPLGEAMRGLFQGNLVVGDYAQIEPRLMAHYSQDSALLRVYRNDLDIYFETARGIFGHDVEPDGPERALCKTLVLAMGYGAYEKKLAQILTINGYPTDVLTAKGYLNELHQLYKGFFEWKDAVIAAVKARGYVQTIGGQHRRLKASFEDRKNWKNINYGERQAVNAIIQGSAADIIRRVMVRMDPSVYGLRLLAQVHDELVWESDERVDPNSYLGSLASDCEIGHGFQLSVPLRFEVHAGSSWFAAKEGTPEGLDEDEEDE
jgi:DNA polymerase I-like protein with 3'-5' exonuclease and polymerase domains